MKKIPKYIYLDYSKQPSKMVCKHCGESRELHLPALIDDALKQAQAFAESHKMCKPPNNKETTNG
jgi:hypothetical protein